MREAFRIVAFPSPESLNIPPGMFACRRIEIGYSDEVLSGIQGCYNDRPFAGYPAGHLRIVRAGFGPGPIVHGVRLYVATVDVVLTGGRAGAFPDRPLDFAKLPPAPTLAAATSTDGAVPPRPAAPNRSQARASPPRRREAD